MYAHHTHYFNKCYNEDTENNEDNEDIAVEELYFKFRQFRREAYDICSKHNVDLKELVSIISGRNVEEYFRNNENIELTIDILDYTNNPKLQIEEECVPSITKILTDRGYKKIEDIYSLKQKD